MFKPPVCGDIKNSPHRTIIKKVTYNPINEKGDKFICYLDQYLVGASLFHLNRRILRKLIMSQFQRKNSRWWKGEKW